MQVTVNAGGVLTVGPNGNLVNLDQLKNLEKMII